ncbi:hypothetical protein [Mycolicibacterium phocaicum]|uniref:hypothetical protein n=1 Tax=Mycolicibacterium phocaicum TaxID=319706 RepID=UPI001CFB5A7F|nr:hypothetical protein [Mycolicibacterium phocaicum]UCZ58635.1 hypothetical protein LHJ73_17830 [Mycolicibacterium phocaicum]
MTVTITGTINDVTARKDSRHWRVWSPVYRQGVNGEIITVTGQSVKVVGGVVTIELEPGAAVIENPDGQRYAVTIPDSDADLWDVIAVAASLPPVTTEQQIQDAVAAYLALSIVDNGDGTFTVTDNSGSAIVDHGDGTYTLTT